MREYTSRELSTSTRAGRAYLHTGGTERCARSRSPRTAPRAAEQSMSIDFSTFRNEEEPLPFNKDNLYVAGKTFTKRVPFEVSSHRNFERETAILSCAKIVARKKNEIYDFREEIFTLSSCGSAQGKLVCVRRCVRGRRIKLGNVVSKRFIGEISLEIERFFFFFSN